MTKTARTEKTLSNAGDFEHLIELNVIRRGPNGAQSGCDDYFVVRHRRGVVAGSEHFSNYIDALQCMDKWVRFGDVR